VRKPPVEPVRDFRRREIGTLLRNRRLAIRPEDANLPRARGRRQQGLRMEDVAELAGVSLSWYARFEAGHDITVSPRTLAAVTRALRMSPYEASHLATLAGTPLAPTNEIEESCAIEDIRAIVEGYAGAPAIAADHRYDLVAANDAARIIFGIRAQRSGFENNCVWRLFMLPQYRTLHRSDWDLQARRMVDNLRSAYARHFGDLQLEALILELNDASPAFAHLWQAHAAAPPADARFYLTFDAGETVLIEMRVITSVPRLQEGVTISNFIIAQQADRPTFDRFIRERGREG
jgi:transcriptional regulator with XRE-family HTH domain